MRGAPPALALAVLLVPLASCSSDSVPDVATVDGPIVLFAVDGLEWRLLLPLLEAGRLPAIAKLMEDGRYGWLESFRPTLSPVLWTSAATGKKPGKHGIRHFVYRSKASGELRYYSSGHRKTKALWNILSDYGRVVHFIGWWMTYPAEVVNGTMVSQTNTNTVLHTQRQAMLKGSLVKGVEGQVQPAAYQDRVMEILDESDRALPEITQEVFGVPPNPTTPFSHQMWDNALWAFRADATYLRVARDILERGEDFDLLAVYVGGPDVTGHRFWRYAFPDEFDHPPPAAQVENFGHVITDAYLHVDRSLGELMALAPENATFVVASDHGMHAFNTDSRFRLEDGHEKAISGQHEDAPAGVVIAAGPFVPRSDDPLPASVDDLPVLGGLLDVAPTILAWKRIPLGEDFDGAPMAGLLQPGWSEANPVASVTSHDTEEWLEARKQRIVEAIDQVERIERLRALGYIR